MTFEQTPEGNEGRSHGFEEVFQAEEILSAKARGSIIPGIFEEQDQRAWSRMLGDEAREITGNHERPSKLSQYLVFLCSPREEALEGLEWGSDIVRFIKKNTCDSCVENRL